MTPGGLKKSLITTPELPGQWSSRIVSGRHPSKDPIDPLSGAFSPSGDGSASLAGTTGRGMTGPPPHLEDVPPGDRLLSRSSSRGQRRATQIRTPPQNNHVPGLLNWHVHQPPYIGRYWYFTGRWTGGWGNPLLCAEIGISYSTFSSPCLVAGRAAISREHFPMSNVKHCIFPFE